MTVDAPEAAATDAHRPARLADVVGQRQTVERLRTVLLGAQARGVKAPHVLLGGPAGTGKTTLARIAAHELGVECRTVSGPALGRAGDIAGILTSIEPGSVVFIDEIHALRRPVQEVLYEAMETGTLTIMVGQGAAARSVSIDLPSFVLVGATTQPGTLDAPLRDRFGVHLTMQPYSDGELAEIAARVWLRAGMMWDPAACDVVGSCAKGTPRLAVHLAQRVLDVAAMREATSISPALAREALDRFGIGRHGLDEIDRRLLGVLTGIFAGRPVGLGNLASALNVDKRTIEDQHEPALIRAGLVIRTAQGRIATPLAYEWMKAEAK